MCRLLGWVSRTPTTAEGLLGPGGLADFTELSCVHGDGWGLARSTGDGVQVAKRADAARTSAAFARAARGWTSELGMAHLRWATLGLGIGPDNTHPFTDGRVAFAHNGSVRPPSSLDALVSPGLRGLRRGDTDSERYFLAVLSRLAEGAAPVEALARTVADVATAGAASSLNGLLLTPDALYAVAWSDPAAAAREGHAPDYYDLGLRRTADAVLVSSSGWGRDWRQLPDHTVTVVRRGSLEVTTVSLDEVLVA